MQCFIGQKSCRQFAIMGVVDDKIKIHWYTFCNFYVSIVYTGYGKGSHIKLYIMSIRNFKWLLQATPLVFMYIPQVSKTVQSLSFHTNSAEPQLSYKQCRASAFKQTVCNNCIWLILFAYPIGFYIFTSFPYRRSLNDYDEPVKVDQVIDPTTGHTYTLPILRKKE